MGGHGQLGRGGNDYGGMATVFVSFVRCALVCQPATRHPQSPTPTMPQLKTNVVANPPALTALHR